MLIVYGFVYVYIHIANAADNLDKKRQLFGSEFIRWCTPGMGVNLWGESPLYVNSVNVNVFSTLTKVLAEGKGVSVRKGLKEARV